MKDYDIRALLRGATHAGVLTGWQGPHTPARSYCIKPADGPARELPHRETIAYCEALTAANVAPRYRASEPMS